MTVDPGAVPFLSLGFNLMPSRLDCKGQFQTVSHMAVPLLMPH